MSQLSLTDFFTSSEITYIPASKIDNSQYQPRSTVSPVALSELKESIRSTNGNIEPVTLLLRDSQYITLAGHRRVAACSELFLDVASRVVANIDDQTAWEIAIFTNVKEDMQKSDLILSVQRLIGFGLTERQIAEKLGISTGATHNYVVCSEYEHSILHLIDIRDVTISALVEIAKLDPDIREYVTYECIGLDLSVRDITQYVTLINSIQNNPVYLDLFTEFKDEMISLPEFKSSILELKEQEAEKKRKEELANEITYCSWCHAQSNALHRLETCTTCWKGKYIGDYDEPIYHCETCGTIVTNPTSMDVVECAFCKRTRLEFDKAEEAKEAEKVTEENNTLAAIDDNVSPPEVEEVPSIQDLADIVADKILGVADKILGVAEFDIESNNLFQYNFSQFSNDFIEFSVKLHPKVTQILQHISYSIREPNFIVHCEAAARDILKLKVDGKSLLKNDWNEQVHSQFRSDIIELIPGGNLPALLQKEDLFTRDVDAKKILAAQTIQFVLLVIPESQDRVKLTPRLYLGPAIGKTFDETFAGIFEEVQE